MLKIYTALHTIKNRLNIFYILAFVPLALIAYYDIRYLSPLFFGFFLLLLKRDKLSTCNEAVHGQKTLGIILVLSSLIVYYALFSFFPFTIFYGGAAGYIAYIFGLFLTFFDLSALKQAFTPIFIIVAAASVSLINIRLKLSISPYVIPRFLYLIGTILNALGVKNTTQYPDSIILNTWRGTLPLKIIWGCVGVYSVLVFSIILIVILFEEPSSLKTKVLWAVIGVIGVLVFNVIRVVTVLVIAYHYDPVVAELLIHPYLGYVLFLTWIILFLSMFSRRESIFRKPKFIKPKTTIEQ